MAESSDSGNKILIDPLFQVPDGAEDQFVFSREGADVDEITFDEEVDQVVEEFQYVEYDDGYEDASFEVLGTPSVFSVLSQTLRRAPGGQQVVDIILETEDIDGATNYEIQVTKL